MQRRLGCARKRGMTGAKATGRSSSSVFGPSGRGRRGGLVAPNCWARGREGCPRWGRFRSECCSDLSWEREGARGRSIAAQHVRARRVQNLGERPLSCARSASSKSGYSTVTDSSWRELPESSSQSVDITWGVCGGWAACACGAGRRVDRAWLVRAKGAACACGAGDDVDRAWGLCVG